MTLALALLISLFGCLTQGEAQVSRAQALRNQAWELIPPYDGEHRYSLGELAGRNNRAAVRLLQAADELESDHAHGLWSLGHAAHLAAIDLQARGRESEAWEFERIAKGALLRGTRLQPEDPWGAYELAQVFSLSGRMDLALPMLKRTLESVEKQLQGEEASGHLQLMRFKALEWQTEYLMRAHRGFEARVKLEAFHREFSTNNWPLHIGLAESFQREWNLEAAAQEYLKIIELFPEDPQALGALGYLRGLQGDSDAAARHLERAIRVELQASLYTRLWLWILCPEDQRGPARTDLVDFLDAPPPSVTEWDLELGSFLVGKSTPEDFQGAAETERLRRLEASQDLDGLMLEVDFYRGLRHVMEKREPNRAAELFRRVLLETPPRWKWEWAFARHYLLKLAGAGPLECVGVLSPEDEHWIESIERGTVTPTSWHVPGDSNPRVDLGRTPRFGDLLLATQLLPGGGGLPVQRVFGLWGGTWLVTPPRGFGAGGR